MRYDEVVGWVKREVDNKIKLVTGHAFTCTMVSAAWVWQVDVIDAIQNVILGREVITASNLVEIAYINFPWSYIIYVNQNLNQIIIFLVMIDIKYIITNRCVVFDFDLGYWESVSFCKFKTCDLKNNDLKMRFLKNAVKHLVRSQFDL